jgi:hypothetical protein
MKKILPLFMLPLIFQSSNALAWGDDGHKIVATVAWNFMTPAAKKQAKLILENNKDTLTENNFVAIAPWADKYRDAGRPDGVAYTGTREWHFIDTPLATTDEDEAILEAEAKICPYVPQLEGIASAGAPANDCIVNKIEQFANELKNPETSMDEKVFALKFIVHFVGDMHQPFHAIDDNDKGGNCVWIKTDHAPYPVSLHSYWDGQLVRNLEKSLRAEDYGYILAKRTEHLNYSEWTKGYTRDWAAESFKIGKNIGYKIPTETLPTCDTENKNQPIELSKDYDKEADQIAEQQLQKAGVRLAAILNGVLK